MISKVEVGSEVKVGEGVKAGEGVKVGSEVEAGSEVKGEAVKYKASKIGPRRVTSLSSSSSSYVMRGDALPQEPLHSTTGGLP